MLKVQNDILPFSGNQVISIKTGDSHVCITQWSI